MSLKEILQANGIEDTIANKILGEMETQNLSVINSKDNDNLNIRYNKLKDENSKHNATIQDLQKQIEDLSKFKTDNSTIVESLQAENLRLKTDNALDRALIEAKVNDVDYMKFKLKEKHVDGFKLDESGKIESLDSMLDDLKVQFPAQFSKTEKKIEEKKLEKGDDSNGGITIEQFQKMNYHERAKLFKEDPEQYTNLNEGKE